MREIYLITILLIGKVILSQSYFPFANDTSQWGLNVKHIITFPSFSIVTNYTTNILKGDSIVYGQSFKKVYQNLVSNSNFLGMYREVNKKIYAKFPTTNHPDTNQVLLYDFNLNIGDTFYLKVKYLGVNEVLKYKIQNISTSSLRLNNRKQYDLLLIDVQPPVALSSNCQNLSWIESIGSDKGIFVSLGTNNPFYSTGPVDSYSLTCYEHKSIQYLQNSCLILGINEVPFTLSKKRSIKIYPNPTTNFCTLNFNDLQNYQNISVEVKNTLGQTLFKTIVNEQSYTLNTNAFNKGLYFITVTQNNQLIAEEKLIILK